MNLIYFLEAFFVFVQFQNYPILLTSKRFWGYCLASAFGSGAFFAYLGGAPAVGAEVYALDPQSVGLFLGAPAFGYFFGNFIAGRYSKSIGIDLMVLYGLALALFGMSLSFAISALGYGSALSFFGFMTFGCKCPPSARNGLVMDTMFIL